MLIDDYHSHEAEAVHIAAEQGSRFAKEVAGDFNPIHDAGERRFCVPGDLLAALVLRHYGIAPHMDFRFRSRVGADVTLQFPRDAGAQLAIADAEGRVCLEVSRAGEPWHDIGAIEALAGASAALSGRNFPDLLEPLMREHGVMFNPARPMVLYESMALSLSERPAQNLALHLDSATLSVDGRRAVERLHFALEQDGRSIGQGCKRVTVSGLQPYDAERMQAFSDLYEQRRLAFRAAPGAG